MTLLKILIGIMTVLIVAGLVAVVWRIATLAGDGDAPMREIDLGLPAGCVIAGATAEDGRAAVTVTGDAGCDAVYIVDLASGEVVLTLRP